MLEEGNSRILIDPSGEEAGNLDKFGKPDAVLYTHEHGDHFSPELTKKFMGQGITVYANASTAKQIDGQPNIVKDAQEFEVGNFKIKVIELPHCLMADGSAGPQNVGYLINKKLFHPGDGKELAGLRVNNLAVPLAGPDISIKDAFDFAKQVSAKVAIPIHYDMMGAKPDFFIMLSTRFKMPFELHALVHGESLEI